MLPHSLFGRSALTTGLALVMFMVLSMSAMFQFIVKPIVQRSANDFAAEIVSAAHSLQSLPDAQQAELERQLLHDHGLMVTEVPPSVSSKPFDSLFYTGFSESLSRLAGEELPVFESTSGSMIWVDVPAHGKTYHLGFDKQRLGINPPVALILAMAGGAVLTLLTSLFDVRRVVRPLDRLSQAVRELGRGRNPGPVPEDGPEEIAELARAFNRMTADIRELSENRTVMMAGISHDLRTPLTRLGIAVEMLDEASNPRIVAGIRRDLEAMNHLISLFLQFSRGIESTPPTRLDLCRVVETLASDVRRQGIEVTLHAANPSCVYSADKVALERVLANLLENAAQHGDGSGIEVYLQCDSQSLNVLVCDRGPGIPEDQLEAVFRPFHRLEGARSGRSGGSGLGLAIARQLAIKHGWSIDLQPREGGGTVAKISMPGDPCC